MTAHWHPKVKMSSSSALKRIIPISPDTSWGGERELQPMLEYKNRLASSLIREAEKLIPGLQDAIVVMDVATPLTFEDQGGRTGGAVAGWSWDFRDSRDSSPRELIRTPIRGLYMAGYQAYSALFLGGIPTAMESGKAGCRSCAHPCRPHRRNPAPGCKPVVILSFLILEKGVYYSRKLTIGSSIILTL